MSDAKGRYSTRSGGAAESPQMPASPRTWWRLIVSLFGREPSSIDTRRLAVRHLFRGHQGEALLCEECRNG